jgi:NAD(P)H dehydrogenase (quinone)
MGRILVMYHSNTDCTSQMAELIAQGARKIPGMVVRLRSCEEAVHDDVIWADGVACGTPCNLGGIAWRMKKWWDDFAADNWVSTAGSGSQLRPPMDPA